MNSDNGNFGSPKKGGNTAIISSLIGAVIGGIVVAALILGTLFFTGTLNPKSTTQTVGGQKVVVNDTEASTAVEAVAQVVPDSVVGITTNVQQQTAYGNTQGTAMGSGFIVTTDGYIVTNAHVIDGSTGDIKVQTNDEKVYNAKVIYEDTSIDLAVLKIDASGLSAVSLGDSDQVKVGQTAIAIGNPLSLEYQRTVTSGIVSALNRTLVSDNQIVAENLIQTDATINSGNSGGPLCNANGEVIGINTYKASQGEGIGFAIPINIAKPIINKIVSSGSFKPIVIGVSGYDAEQAYYLSQSEVSFDKGIYIAGVSNGGPAAAAGLQKGDIITAINNNEVNTMLQMKTVLYGLNSGDEITITYQRGGKEESTRVKVTEGSASNNNSSSSDNNNNFGSLFPFGR